MLSEVISDDGNGAIVVSDVCRCLYQRTLSETADPGRPGWSPLNGDIIAHKIYRHVSTSVKAVP